MHIPYIQCPHVRVNDDTSSGQLVIIDTPGPNEAGQIGSHLKNTVDLQLRRASSIAVILDYTQLNADSAVELRHSVAEAAEIRGQENLFVIVNKVDQRGKEDLSPKQVIEFVHGDLGVKPASILETQAKKGMIAKNYMVESRKNPQVPPKDLPTARIMVEKVIDAAWMVDSVLDNRENVERIAHDQWDQSGLRAVLEEVIAVLQANAAPRAMTSALRAVRHQIDEVQKYAAIRRGALEKSVKEVKLQIDELERDIKAAESIWDNRLPAPEKIKSEIRRTVSDDIALASKRLKGQVEEWFASQGPTSRRKEKQWFDFIFSPW